ncbi:uncharacterized protein BDV14DRAFT_199992 [Aspergillus stella-maris]|uniref:uncharacterized protein n=1 Tax=Aspergillus stella-maris TaxID=1810926 RepID=UPI003CCD05D6
MSSTSTSTAAAATCTGNAWVLPVQDVACAVTSVSDNYTTIMNECCKDATVENYNDDCGLYCLAQGQTGQELLDCISDQGATDGDFFCGGRLNETSSEPTPTSDDDDEDSDDASSTHDADAADTTDNAAVHLGQPVNKAGLGVLAMLVVSAVMGVVA